MKYKAYDLMKAAKENSEKYKDKRYKVVEGTVIDHSGSESKEIQFCTTGQMSTGIFVAYISSDTVLEEIPPEPKPVPFMEAVKAYSEGKTIRCEVVPSVTNQVYEYEPVGNRIGLHGYTLSTCKGSGTPVTTKEILEGEWFIKE